MGTRPLLFDLGEVVVDAHYVDTRDIPQPFRSQFVAAMNGQQRPAVEGKPAGSVFYTSDWLEWASGKWRGGERPNPYG